VNEWVKIVGRSIGPVLAVAKFLIDFVQETHPMNFESWGFWLIVLCSCVYGVCSLTI
jgi:hypothetical protein